MPITDHEYLPPIEGHVASLLAGKWTDLAVACADSNLRYPGVYVLAFSEKPLTGKQIKVRDIFYVGMSTARKGVQQRLRQFKAGIERNDHHSGAMRFYREHANGQPFSTLKTHRRFYAAARVIRCGRESVDDWRDMGHVACLECYVIAHVLAKTKKIPALNLPKERAQSTGAE